MNEKQKRRLVKVYFALKKKKNTSKKN